MTEVSDLQIFVVLTVWAIVLFAIGWAGHNMWLEYLELCKEEERLTKELAELEAEKRIWRVK
jgi:cell division protein FtsB